MRSAVRLVGRARRRAEALMIDTCEFVRETGEPGPIDPDTGEREPAPTTVVYSGKCKVQTYEPHEQTPESGEHVYSVQRYSIHLPAGTDVRVDDQGTILTATLDAGLVGRSYRVAGLLHKSMATAQRVLVDEIVR